MTWVKAFEGYAGQETQTMMKTPDWVDESRRSVAYFGVSRREHPAVGHLMASMFVEDIKLVSLRARRKEQGFEVALNSAEQNSEREVANLLGEFDTGWRGELEETVPRFVDEAVLYLAYFGETRYELVRPPNVGAPDSLRASLVILPPGGIVDLGYWIVQLVPPGSWRDVGKRLAVLPKSDVWHLTLPRELGGAKGHRRLLRALAEASAPAPEFSLEDMRRQRSSLGYDFKQYHRDMEIAAASLTLDWGWPGRGMWNESCLEYFTVYRNLRFARSRAVLRDHVIRELNSLLEREGFKCSIVVKGVPDPSEFDDLIRRLSEGQLSFKDGVKAAFQ
jgi:hypothetical protein